MTQGTFLDLPDLPHDRERPLVVDLPHPAAGHDLLLVERPLLDDVALMILIIGIGLPPTAAPVHGRVHDQAHRGRDHTHHPATADLPPQGTALGLRAVPLLLLGEIDRDPDHLYDDQRSGEGNRQLLCGVGPYHHLSQ